MELAFANKSLRALCENQLKAERELGVKVARNLRARLADLRDAESITQIVAGNPRVLDPVCGHMAIALGKDMSIIFVPNHLSNPTNDAGEINWSQVTRIQVTHIGVDE